jgi:restriction system protein
MTVWLVRSGKYGERESFALDNGLAVIGWDELDDLSALKERADLQKELAAVYADEKPKTLTNWESQIWPFVRLMENGDLVVMPLKSRSAIAIGRIAGPYVHRADLADNRHTRAVKWQAEVPRAKFAQDLLYSFGSFMTVCSIHRNNAEARIIAVLAGRSDPGLGGAAPAAGKPAASADGAIASADDADAGVDLEAVAGDAIRRRISSAFKSHRLAALIGAILDAQGYAVFVSPPGADGGVDILAGKGALGFDAPRLAVQVKSQDSRTDVATLRELQGVMKQFGATQGLLVAWGGVTTALRKEALRQYFDIRIWDDGDVIRELKQYYDRLPDDLQTDLPLRRIWILADEA